MKRSGFKRPEYVRAPRAPLVRRPMPEPQVVAAPLRVVDQRAQLVVPLPKGPKTKPGKYTPNAEERAWMDWIVGYGCVACRMGGLGVRPAAVHHMLSGGRRMGHLFTLPLCDPGHHQGGQSLGMVSRHPWRVQFERKYGSEASLHSMLKTLRASALTGHSQSLGDGLCVSLKAVASLDPLDVE